MCVIIYNMRKKTKKILTSVAIIIVFVFLGKQAYDYRFQNSTRWRFIQSVPKSEYEQYIVGKWKTKNGDSVEYTEDGEIINKISSGLNEPLRGWNIDNGYLHTPILGESSIVTITIQALNSKYLVLGYPTHGQLSYEYYSRIE